MYINVYLTPLSRDLFESKKLLSYSKNPHPYYENISFIAALTTANHLTVQPAIPVNSNSGYFWRSILQLSFPLRLGLPCALFLSSPNIVMH